MIPPVCFHGLKAASTALVAALLASPLLVADPASAQSRSAPVAEAAAPDPLLIVVSLRRQRLTVFNKSGTVTQSPVSSGQPEFPTPTGVFSVIGKEVEHESNLYEGASMPYMQRLTWSGTAMHAGNLPGYAASHGCVRLPYGFSQRLFGMTSINTRVIVTHDDVAPQPFSHPRLFTPMPGDTEPAKDQPTVSAATSRVASLVGIAPAMATEAAPPSNVLPLSAKAKARLAATNQLLAAIKPAEVARLAVWDKVKAANRALETAKSSVERAQEAVDDGVKAVDRLQRAKRTAEQQLAAVIRKAERTSSDAALEALGRAEEAAEARIIDVDDQLDAAVQKVDDLKSEIPKAEAVAATAETARRALDDELRSSNQALKDAHGAYALAKREDARYLKPVSVFISRKDQRIYVRQGFDPVLEAPVTITEAEQPVGTHIYTAMGVKAGSLQWSVVSMQTPTRSEEARRAKAGLSTRLATASKVLDRITIPQDALDAIRDVIKPGSSLIVSDESTSDHFGSGTDFTVAVR